MGFVFAFPGKVQANQFQVTISVEENQVSQSLVEQILRQVEQEFGVGFHRTKIRAQHIERPEQPRISDRSFVQLIGHIA